MREKRKTKKWIKWRHKLVRNLAWVAFWPSIKFKYRAKIDKFADSKNRQYLVLYNHQTAFDQFFVGITFSRPVYYVASEDLFSNGWISRLLKFVVAPIPIKKQTNDVKAVMTCMRVAKEGGTIAIAPEGNRTYSGRTGYFKPSIVKLAKALKMPIAILRIEDGYGVQPRWADSVRKGGMRVYVKSTIEADEFLKMTDGELYQRLKDELYVDESSPNKEFHHKNLANYIERAMYYCPDCGFSVFESRKDIITCKKCNKTVRYLPNKQLKGEGFDFKYQNIAKWYDGQCGFINSQSLDGFTKTPLYVDKTRFSEVVLYKNKRLIDKKAEIKLFGDRIEVSGKKPFVFDFDRTGSVTVLGRNKINIYFDQRVYQIKGDKRMNALKYVNVYHRYKNIHGGENDEFLGL